jgi:chromosome partitioning protein
VLGQVNFQFNVQVHEEAFMTIISVFARKGGVGKTTTAANLAAALAMEGGKVLAVDADSQGHLALALGAERVPLFSEWAAGGDLLSLDVSGPWLETKTVCAGFGSIALVAGGNESLALDLNAAAVQTLAYRLRAHATALGADWVVIDSPAIGPLQDFAAAASDLAILPAPCHFLGASGAVDARALVQKISTHTRVMALPTMFERREKDARHWLYVLGLHFPDLLPAVPHRVAVAESLAVGLPVVLFKPNNPAAVAYMDTAAHLRAALAVEIA